MLVLINFLEELDFLEMSLLIGDKDFYNMATSRLTKYLLNQNSVVKSKSSVLKGEIALRKRKTSLNAS